MIDESKLQIKKLNWKTNSHAPDNYVELLGSNAMKDTVDVYYYKDTKECEIHIDLEGVNFKMFTKKFNTLDDAKSFSESEYQKSVKRVIIAQLKNYCKILK